MMRRTALLALITLAAGCDSGPDAATLPFAPELGLSPVAASAAPVSVEVFGPVRVVREGGTPVTRTLAMDIPDPAQFAAFQLRIVAEATGERIRGAAMPSARVDLNGVEILGPSDLPKDGSWLLPVSLAAANVLEVTVLGAPGGALTLSIRGTLKAVAKVVVDPASLQLEVGDAASLTVTALADDGTVLTGREILWTSSAPGVATVSSSGDALGCVQALGPGTAWVSASVEEESGAATVVVKAAPPGPIAYFPFDGDARDATGNGHDGTAFGAMLTADRFGEANRAYRFDGVASYIESDVINFPGAFSLVLWVKGETKRDGTMWGGLVGKYTAQGNWELNINDMTQRALFHTSTNTGAWSPQPLVADRWYHLAATYDGQGTGRVYVDGVLVVTQPGMGNPPHTGVAVRIGRSAWGGNPFQGTIDEVGLYDYALSAKQVGELSAGRPAPVT